MGDYGDAFKGLVWLAIIGMAAVPIAVILGVVEIVHGIAWLCHHVRFQ